MTFRLAAIGVIDAATGERIGLDSPRWPEYEAWIAAGNVPEPIAAVAPSRAALIADRWGWVKERRQRVTEGGVLVGAHWLHTDLYSRTQWLGMLVAGAGLPAGINWKTMSGDFVTLTPTLVQQVFAAIQAKELAAFAHGEALRSALDAADDPRDVDIDAGWPASFNDPQPAPPMP